MRVEVPGHGEYDLRFLVLDYNGTLAVDGRMEEETRQKLQSLASFYTIFVLSADTFGTVREQCLDLPLAVEVAPALDGAVFKENFVRNLGAEHVAAIGNGFNDRLMLQTARLGIVVLGGEACSREALLAADLVAPEVNQALDLLLNPARLVASLRG